MIYSHKTERLLARIAAKACRKHAKAVAMSGYILNNVSEKKHI